MTDEQKKKREAPKSLRLPLGRAAELSQRAQAAGMSENAYMLVKIFGEENEPLQRRGHFPVKDHRALSQILGFLGASRIFSNANQIAKDINTGCFEQTPEAVELIREIQDHLGEIRDLLLAALGKRGRQ